jgi:hypothetical protein
MADLTYKQSIQILAGKTPNPNYNITEKDFEINPPETLSVTDLNEDLFHRFVIPAGSLNMNLPMGTVSLGKLLYLKPQADLAIKITNVNGTSQDLVFKADRSSILHLEFSALQATNSTAVPIKGILFIAGD